MRGVSIIALLKRRFGLLVKLVDIVAVVRRCRPGFRGGGRRRRYDSGAGIGFRRTPSDTRLPWALSRPAVGIRGNALDVVMYVSSQP